MKFRLFGKSLIALMTLFCSLGFTSALEAQTAGTSTLRGTVTDPSGAAIVGATVLVTSSTDQTFTTQSGKDGVYVVKNLAADTYSLTIGASGFSLFEKDGVTIAAGDTQTVDAQLAIEIQNEQVTVTDTTTSVDVNPANNASALILKGKDLDALSDDPDELQSELEALAGPAAGPNGGQIYIDGFTGGQLPPKSSIREIRINQNPFSAEYDKLGYGRIEIFTKPGTDKYHGQLLIDGNDSAFNSRNPFSPTEPAYYTTFFSGNLSGPINRKASFFLDIERRDINNVEVVSAEVLDPNFNPVPFSAAVPNPNTRTTFSPRLDWQLTPSNTLTLRYRDVESNQTSGGVGQFNLASQGYNVSNKEQVVQAVDNQVISPKIVNETRFQFTLDQDSQSAQNFTPSISVLGAFNGGGNNQGLVAETDDTYEIQNYTSISAGKHFIKFGGRLRAYQVNNNQNSNFNGTFTFGSRAFGGEDLTGLQAYQITEQGLANGLTLAQIQAQGGGPSQFLISTGNPFITVNQFDLGLYVQDDWRVRPNITVSMGGRLETQNNIRPHGDLAPRLGVAWGLGGGKNKTPKTVLRAGFGFFYDRFMDTYAVEAEQQNGVNQQQYVINNPNFFPTIPPINLLASNSTSIPTIYQINPTLRAPYTIQTAASVERQISKSATLAVTYINSRGVHAFLSQNINAPLPGTFNPADPTSGVRPLGVLENIDQFQSDGIFNQNQLIANVNFRLGSKLSLFGYYTLNDAKSDTAGVASFPANQFDLAQDYGRASFDVRNRMFLAGSWSAPYGIRVSPFIVAASGAPFNITIGQDIYGQGVFTERPAFATSATLPQNLVATKYGNFDLAPAAGEPLIPVNYGDGPGQFTMNLRISKTIGLGKKLESSSSGAAASGGGQGPGGGAGGGGGRGGAGGGAPGGGLGPRGLSGSGGSGGGPFSFGSTPRKYNLTLAVSARNLFNNVNFGMPIGTLTSPLFGRSNSIGGIFTNATSSSANRRIDLLLTFSF
ncbi:MAG: carboxypeptidase regulatory-like domain-containing protein [Candidatus Acidiferrales bacterium]